MPIMMFSSVRNNPGLFTLVERVFREKIEPLYGDQSAAIEKIKSGVDRDCEIMFIDGQPKGLLVYKTKLQNEYGLEDAFELKNMSLFDHINDKGLGELLLERAERNAKKVGARYAYGTVCNNNKLVEFMKKHGWVVTQSTLSSDNLVDVHVIYKKLALGEQPGLENNSIMQLLNFFHLCEKLKIEKRNGKTSDNEHDLVASHSWRMAVMSVLLFPFLEKKIDLLKALKLALFHDIAEIITGDAAYFHHMFSEDAKMKKSAKENDAMKVLISKLPLIIKKELIELHVEYHDQTTYESRVIKAIDKMEAQIQHNEANVSVWNEYDRKHYTIFLNQFCDFDNTLKILSRFIQEESNIKLTNGK
ncbi:putative hydrolases of HD superfamily [Gammaproteobacteria bacterium]